MSKRKKDRLNVSDPSRILTHNPFAALGKNSAPPDKLASADVKAVSVGQEACPTRQHREGRVDLSSARLVVRRERAGRGGKTITRIEGLAPVHREEILARLRKALGCGGTLEGDDLILNGALVDRAAKWLQDSGAKRVSRSA